MREAVGQQDLHARGQLWNIARQRIAHLNRTRQFGAPLLQHLSEVLAGIPDGSFLEICLEIWNGQLEI